jgi:hypothetical protein
MVLLNANSTAGAASSEAKKTLPRVGLIDINRASIDELKSRLAGSRLISENAGPVAINRIDANVGNTGSKRERGPR